MVRSIIWDWNGTLLDDTWICYEIANIMLKERGLQRISDFERYRQIFRFPVIDWYVGMGYTFEKLMSRWRMNFWFCITGCSRNVC